jgi:CHAT domain-containing protein
VLNDSVSRDADRGQHPHILVGVSSFPGERRVEFEGREHLFRFDVLPGAKSEVEAVGRLLEVEPMIDSLRAASAILAPPGRVSILHLATHGVTFVGNPVQSFLVLPDAVLPAARIYESRIKADIVVMSACRTGLGGAHPDSRIGLANAFLIAGAKTVVSTLWSIPDLMTAKMIPVFYEELVLGQSPASAIRKAQLNSLESERGGDPSVWGAFKVTGHDAPLFPPRTAKAPGQ